jgi:hypothetical protein
VQIDKIDSIIPLEHKTHYIEISIERPKLVQWKLFVCFFSKYRQLFVWIIFFGELRRI